jgi:mRNA-degrading endonuclease RelE of RelBE toxin-antitoxin system
MEHFAHRTFWDRYDRLPDDVRALADKNYKLLADNPRHPSLRLKRIGRLWSVRVGDNYRAVGVDSDAGILWIWIGTHEEYERFIRQ